MSTATASTSSSQVLCLSTSSRTKELQTDRTTVNSSRTGLKKVLIKIKLTAVALLFWLFVYVGHYFIILVIPANR